MQAAVQRRGATWAAPRSAHGRRRLVVHAEARTVATSFRVQRHLQYGLSLAMVGSNAHLGAWDPKQCVPMTWSQGNFWLALNIPLSAGEKAEYKYVVRNKSGEVIEWQPGGNLQCVPPVEAEACAVNDSWDGRTNVTTITKKYEAPAPPPARSLSPAPVVQAVQAPAEPVAPLQVTAEPEPAVVVQPIPAVPTVTPTVSVSLPELSARFKSSSPDPLEAAILAAQAAMQAANAAQQAANNVVQMAPVTNGNGSGNGNGNGAHAPGRAFLDADEADAAHAATQAELSDKSHAHPSLDLTGGSVPGPLASHNGLQMSDTTPAPPPEAVSSVMSADQLDAPLTSSNGNGVHGAEHAPNVDVGHEAALAAYRAKMAGGGSNGHGPAVTPGTLVPDVSPALAHNISRQNGHANIVTGPTGATLRPLSPVSVAAPDSSVVVLESGPVSHPLVFSNGNGSLIAAHRRVAAAAAGFMLPNVGKPARTQRVVLAPNGLRRNDLGMLTISELRVTLRRHGLGITGNRMQLLRRLSDAGFAV